ncbi:MAG: hypothetical protein OXP28_03620 [Gammaproteobacteria bacterium]|nr:hypothetical protein [Gammaproteobacteria bacterium]MDE0224204.1 hypothetical protein [Gammaproteobacteria bacterium]
MQEQADIAVIRANATVAAGEDWSHPGIRCEIPDGSASQVDLARHEGNNAHPSTGDVLFSRGSRHT